MPDCRVPEEGDVAPVLQGVPGPGPFPGAAEEQVSRTRGPVALPWLCGSWGAPGPAWGPSGLPGAGQAQGPWERAGTSREGALHVVDDLVVVADDVVTVDDDGHLLAQVEPHEPGLLELALRQAHVPLLAGQALLGDHQSHLQAPGSERGRQADTGDTAQAGGACGEGGQRSHTGGGHCCFQPGLGHWGGGGLGACMWQWGEHGPAGVKRGCHRG